MIYPRPAFAAVVTLVLTSFVPVLQAQKPVKPAPPKAPEAVSELPPPPSKPLKGEDIQKILSQLTEIRDTLSGKRSSYNSTLLTKLKDASSSPDKAFGLWLDATKQVDYDGQGKTQAEFSEFRNTKGKVLRTDGNFTAQIRLQVKFMMLVVLNAEAKTPAERAEVAAGAAAYLEDFVASVKKLDGKFPELNRSVMDTAIAKHLKMDVTLPKAERTALNAGSLSEIYENLILPLPREKRAAAAISAAWQKRIAQELAIVEAERVPEKTEIFRREREPSLKWRQAKDLFEAGEQAPATAAMLSLIKANMGHKETASWIGELAELVKAQEKYAPSAAEPNTTQTAVRADAGAGAPAAGKL